MLPPTAPAVVCAEAQREGRGATGELPAWLSQQPHTAVDAFFEDQRDVVGSLVLRMASF